MDAYRLTGPTGEINRLKILISESMLTSLSLPVHLFAFEYVYPLSHLPNNFYVHQSMTVRNNAQRFLDGFGLFSSFCLFKKIWKILWVLSE